MVWFTKRRLVYLVVMVSMLTLSVAGVASAATDSLKRLSPEEIEARIQAAVDEGKITQEEADKKREHIAEGGKRFGKGNGLNRLSSEEIEARIQAAVDEGKITQEEADKKLQMISEKSNANLGDANITT